MAINAKDYALKNVINFLVKKKLKLFLTVDMKMKLNVVKIELLLFARTNVMLYCRVDIIAKDLVANAFKVNIFKIIIILGSIHYPC